MSTYVKLRDLDAVELAEMLDFVRDWIDYADDDLRDTMSRFTAGGYTLDDLRADLGRFAFLLGSNEHRYLEAPQ